MPDTGVHSFILPAERDEDGSIVPLDPPDLSEAFTLTDDGAGT